MPPLMRMLRGEGRLFGAGGRRPVQLEEIATERLSLRPLSMADVRRVAILASDWGIASMTARIPFPYTERDAAEWIGGLDASEAVAAIERAGVLIGLVGYSPAADGRSAEIGYWIGRPYWGQGFATEAASAMLSHCFAKERFERLTCCHFLDNPASRRVIEKLGFRALGQCSAWSEARRCHAPTQRYELRAPKRWDWSGSWPVRRG